MGRENIVEQINQAIEDIWIVLQREEGQYSSLELNNQQQVLLTLIVRHPFSSSTELAKKMNITKSAVSQQLSRLEKEGYIIKRQDIEDKRSFTIELAAKGLQYKEETQEFKHRISKRYHANLSPSELTDILSALQKLRKTLVDI